MSKDQNQNRKLHVENVDNFHIMSDYLALSENFVLNLKNYCYCVYAEKIYKNLNTSVSKKKFKNKSAAIRYYKKLKENPKVCLTYMGIVKI